METAGGMAGPAIPFGLCYGKEEGCDINFLAGRDEDQWRLPAHKFLLVQVNPVFKAMLSPHFLPDSPLPHTILIDDVEGRAFDNLLRFLYNEPVPLQSVETALMTLYVSHKYLCSGLARVCISYLSDNLSQSNVLPILKWITIFCGDDHQNLENLAKEKEIKDSTQNLIITDGLMAPSAPQYHEINNEDSKILVNSVYVNVKDVKKDKDKESKKKSKPSDAPPIIQFKENQNPELEMMMTGPGSEVVSDFEKSQIEIENIQKECACLLLKCLLFVDESAEAILSSEEFEDLNDTTVRLILRRDSLNVKNEMTVFLAMMKWADKECKRRQLPLISGSVRLVLAESVFLPRYLTMSLSEFSSACGPANAGIFTKEEIVAFVKILKEDIVSVSMASPKKGQLDNEKINKLISLSFSYTPATLRPFIHELIRPRTPLNNKSSSTTAKLPGKKRRVSMIQSWMCLKNCCKLLRNSNPSSPANSNQSSPIRSFHCCQNNQNARRNQENLNAPNRCSGGHNNNNEQLGHNQPSMRCATSPSSLNVAVERFVICWAFFFD